MNWPDTFPEGTEFLDVDGVPVTRHPGRAGALAWDEPDAEQPRWFPAEAAARGTPITESECHALYLRNVHRAPPSRLLAAAIDLRRMEDAYLADLQAQGLTPAQIAEVFARNRAENQALEAQRLAIQLIGRAMRQKETR